MRKITELDGPELYQQTGLMPWLHSARKHQLKPEWIELVFNPLQRQFLVKHRYCARPHPRHNPTIEIFVDEHTLDDADHTLVALLF